MPTAGMPGSGGGPGIEGMLSLSEEIVLDNIFSVHQNNYILTGLGCDCSRAHVVM